jgi:tripartite-type tricarboxylate transporter receptor subunit TctC
VPTVGDSVAGYEASTWYGVVAPRETPPDVIGRLNSEINAGIAEPGMQARFAEIGGIVFGGAPAAFGKLIADDTEKWGKVIRAANVRL